MPLQKRPKWTNFFDPMPLFSALKAPFSGLRVSFRITGLLALLLLFGLSGCLGDPNRNPIDDAGVNPNDGPDKIFADAQKDLGRKRYDSAAAKFDAIERYHPASSLAARGQIMSVYSNYLGAYFDDAISGANAFVQTHPGHPNIDYAYYIRALSYFEQIGDVSREQSVTLEAKSALESLVKNFPNSRFAPTARNKLALVEDQLAGKEMAIGRYYQQQEHYNAAIGRFSYVVENYQQTGQIQEALHRLAESYLALGLLKESRAAASVLGHNYPSSPWYARTYTLLQDKGLLRSTER